MLLVADAGVTDSVIGTDVLTEGGGCSKDVVVWGVFEDMVGRGASF